MTPRECAELVERLNDDELRDLQRAAADRIQSLGREATKADEAKKRELERALRKAGVLKAFGKPVRHKLEATVTIEVIPRVDDAEHWLLSVDYDDDRILKAATRDPRVEATCQAINDAYDRALAITAEYNLDEDDLCTILFNATGY